MRGLCCFDPERQGHCRQHREVGADEGGVLFNPDVIGHSRQPLEVEVAEVVIVFFDGDEFR